MSKIREIFEDLFKSGRMQVYMGNKHYNDVINQATKEIESLMLTESELANIIYSLICCDEHQEDVDFEDCKSYAKAIITAQADKIGGEESNGWTIVGERIL